ncbi:MAG TPA: acetamidase/formamidase family protein, partial [Candidatus Angelobacter sp.]|nr:acetamidase/formamidase family protein [Candidatus Angelobacter sp.]
MKGIWSILFALLLSASSSPAARAQEKTAPAPPHRNAAAASKHHSLPATPNTVQWGWFDVNEKPKLTINSGDTVSVETWYHALNQIKPSPEDRSLSGPPMEEIAQLRKQNDGGGPHSITGPIYVNGAEPGDTLEIRILKIVPKEYAQNFNLPGKDFPTGLLPKEFLDGFVRYYKLDLAKNETEFKPGIILDLKPFPGIL